MKILDIFKKILQYTIVTFLIMITLASAGVYFFQDKIIALTFEEINKHLITKIEVDKNVNLSIFDKFPQISIQLNNVRIYENVPGSKEKLGTLKHLYFTFDAIDFFQGKYVVNHIYAESGDIKIKLDKNGLPNYNIIKEDTGTSSNISLNLKKIMLENVMVYYINLSINQTHQVFVEKAESTIGLAEKVWQIGLNGDLLVYKIGIGGNEYFKEKSLKINSHQEYYEETSLFKIHPSNLFIQGSEFKFSGFYEGKNNEIDIRIKAEKSTIATLISLLPQKISHELSVYKSSGNIFFDASIKGFIAASKNPNIRINFGFNNASFSHPDYNQKIHSATLKGTYSNGNRQNLYSSSLILSNVNGILDGKKISGNFELINFIDPFLKFNLTGSLDVRSLIKFYPIKKISDANGLLDFNLTFEGKSEDLKTQEGKERIKAEGDITINNLNLIIKDSPILYKKINGNFYFNKNDVVIRELTGYAGKSDLNIEGSFRNFIPKVLFNKEKMLIEATVLSNHIDLDELLNSFSSDTESSKENKNNPYPYLSDYKFKLDCKINHLNFKRLHATNLQSQIDFNQPHALIKNTTFQMSGGLIQMNSAIYFKSKENIEINTKTTLSNIHIDSVFYIAENFNQDFLTDKNLKGQFNGEVKLYFSMDHELNIHGPTVVAVIDASILNGELNNFDPMKKLSKFINEDELENVRFSELKNKIYIENSTVVIPEMEIKTNISNISVLGSHTFDQHMDYKLSVPLKNFKKKHSTDKDEAFGAIEKDNRGNTVVFLTIKGTTDNYKIAYDTKRTGAKIKEGLKKEKKEIEDLFKRKKPIEIEQATDPNENEFFGEDFSF